ncbi:ATP-binding protein [uncultured Thiodictyon sp.]|uniref:ATP-binding protein n=1 Tax=uncultured Thiodictyon sp. TaxID=1846217 RepID=UPI0025DCAF51|nr:ATP-binding protein [uncultured Thiodictyon sp.]
MTLSIRAKLFLTLLLACLLVVIGTHAFVGWSLQQGLIELADARENERIAEIAERLTAVYAQDGGWEALRADARRWVSVLIGREIGREPPPGREPGLGGPERPPPSPPDGPRRNRWPAWVRHALAEPGVWPPPTALEHLRERDRPPPTELRLMLLDAAGAVVYGQPDRLAGARRRPLELNGQPIGSLAILPGPTLSDLPEIEFQSRQGSRLWIIALGMLLVSAALASPLSRWLVRPVRRIQEATRRLAAGDFSARVRVQGGDELARLGANLNALAATLEGNEQARRRWVADIAHELRTPIALLRAELEAMQDEVRPLDRAGVDALHADVLRLGRLVGDLHELSVTDLGALSYRMVETDLRELLEADLDAFRPRFAAAGLALELDDRAPGPVILTADPDRLSQAMRNLLGNSLKYTDMGGGLTVTLSRAPGEVTLDFRDTAPGCPPESLPRLFDRLYRVEGSRSRQTGGAGLGLAIVKNVIEAHGGAIRAAAAPAGGLWIHVALPVL